MSREDTARKTKALLALMMEAAVTSETPVRRCNPEDGGLRTRRGENFRSCVVRCLSSDAFSNEVLTAGRVVTSSFWVLAPSQALKTETLCFSEVPTMRHMTTSKDLLTTLIELTLPCSVMTGICF
jgi:hypothetical protein